MIRPLGERVLVEPIEQEETTAFGIVLPDSAKEKPQEGKVIAVGSGSLKDGARVPLEGKEYLIMKESDIHAILG
jgi:chaperonin GroES